MNPSKNHNNWLTIGEIINLVRKPVTLYADHVVKKWHKKLCQDCRLYGRCAKPEDCLKQKKSKNLCSSCKGWYQKLESSHRNRSNPSQIRWRQNCDTSRWPDDPWEVAKFFMSILGHNQSTVKNAEFTDLSSLLNVLEWMEDVAFGGDRRVDLNLVGQLRSEVRNTWAHSPKQEMSDDQLNNSFEIVYKFLKDLDTVFSSSEVKECLIEIQRLQANGLTNVAEAELKSLILLRKQLQGDVSQMKEEIKTLREDQTSNSQFIQEHESNLKKLEVVTEECSARMDEFHQWKERLDSLFNDMKREMENMRDETRKDIMEIRADVEKIQEAMNIEKHIEPSSKLKSYLPDRPPSFVGRTEDVEKVESFLEKKDSGVISIIGGPGFGKSTIAIEVSHLISSEHGIPVIFSHLSNASTKSEVVLRLCRDIGISPEEDTELSLLSWLRKMEKEVVLVMDNIEQLLEDGTHSDFIDLVRSIRKACSSLKIITTSRKALVISDLKIQEVRLEEMNKQCSMELVKSRCPELQFPDDDIADLAKLCGHVPLALCIAATLLNDTRDIKKVIEWLKEEPMETLQSCEVIVRNVIQTSFDQLKEEDIKRTFAQLSVFNGHFSKDDAQAVTELKKGSTTHHSLMKLFDRCLIQRNADKFSLHHLIKMFLVENADFNEEKDRAKKVMVDYFLSRCHSLTLKYWSNGGFLEARRLLQVDMHNIEETLKLCQEAVKGPKISKEIASSLQESEIYQSSCRFFYRFIEYILPKSVTKGFLDACAELAKGTEGTALKINYNCLVASAIPNEGTPFSAPESVEILEKTKDIVDGREQELERDNKLILAYFYDSYGRYLQRKSERFPEAGEHFQKALEIRQRVTANLERVDKVFTLMALGRYEKRRTGLEAAIDNHLKAINFAEEILGDHTTTAKCYKVLGDCYLQSRKSEEALEYYDLAKKIYDSFYQEGNFSPFLFFLLKMRGLCMHYLKNHEDAVRTCVDAMALAKILDDDRCKAQAHFALATVLNKWSHPDERLEHAKEVVRLQKFLLTTDYEKQNIWKIKKIINSSRQ